ncbi:hypothetical protein L218DRAFT_962892 [Marasmius fiardii PR-910]|nr:hypothetical protein L218DRAFT_962892 [Marasmius fiardii PR-910]
MFRIPVLLTLATTLTQLLVIAKPLETRADISPDVSVEFVRLRIEGAEKTIFEGLVPTFGHTIKTASGGRHRCDGTNNNANPRPGPTCTTALSDASRLHGFSFDGTFDTKFDDYLITSIGGDSQTATQFWGLLVNYQFAPKGGCQTEVSRRDEILWAFAAFRKVHFLKLEAPLIAKPGTSVLLKVTDGANDDPLRGAAVKRVDGSNGAVVGTSNASGTVSVHLPDPGIYSFKASKDDSIRSNSVTILVSA